MFGFSKKIVNIFGGKSKSIYAYNKILHIRQYISAK